MKTILLLIFLLILGFCLFPIFADLGEQLIGNFEDGLDYLIESVKDALERWKELIRRVADND